MATTVEILRSKSENMKNAIKQFVNELKQTNEEMIAYQRNHEAQLEHLKAKHEAELAQLVEDFEDMTEEVEENKKFIESVEALLAACAEEK